MKSRTIVALFLLSLATGPGCLLEVESEAEGESAWAEQPLGSEEDPQDVALGDNAPAPDSDWADGPVADEEWTHRDGVVEEAEPTLAGWLPQADPGPDPWH